MSVLPVLVDTSHFGQIRMYLIRAISDLPRKEQYRYVAFDPNRSPYVLDWTHEREWRWKADETLEVQRLWMEDIDEFEPALPLFLGKMNDGYFSSIGIVVWNHQEAQEVAQLLLFLQDAGHNDVDTHFDQGVISKTFVIILEQVVQEVETNKNMKANRVEDVSSSSSATFKLVRPEPTPLTVRRVKKALAHARTASSQAAQLALSQAPKNRRGEVLDVCGFASVVTADRVLSTW